MTVSAHDAVVIGGGVTGAGVARDLARRGASVLLLEKDDYGGGTSGASSWMIHGGPRYLEFDWRTTRLSCEDAGKIVAIARHMVHRVVFLLPVLAGDKHNIERLETAMEVYDRFQPLKGSNPHIRLTAGEARRLEPGLTDQLLGAMTMEEWGVDPHRLTWANVQDAVEHGATAANHSRVIGIIRDGRQVLGVRYRGPDGGVHEARAKVTINATGPWSPGVAGMAGLEVKLRPAKGIHLVYDRRISNYAISADGVDGRGLLLVPHGNFTLVGTTDDDFYGDPDDIEVMPDEVDYILQAFDRILPGLRGHRAIRATAGVRPTIYRWRSYEDDLSRRHELVDHETRDATPGLVSIIGGKLSMYRLMAEETADLVCRKLGLEQPCTTGTAPLPGNEVAAEPAAELAGRYGITALAAARLQTRQGCRAARVFDGRRDPGLVCRCEPLTASELGYAARTEQVRTLADAFRRVGLASGPCSGALCVERAAEVIGRELDWSPSQRREAAEEFRAQLWLGRAPVMDQWGWAEQELIAGSRIQ
ncbi:MAG: FAD-dependent oxidoreductase [Candidatus Dormibacteraeota bacterium]|nr:FAD-dependent oxidoreductase [Candidatus Dormibacteraeota bacterium]